MADLITQISIQGDGSGGVGAVREVKQELGTLGPAAEAAGTAASKGIEKIGAGGKRAADDMDRVTKQIAQQIQRLTATLEAGEKGTSAFFRALGTMRGADLNALEPLLVKLDAVRAKQEAIKREAEGVEFIANLREKVATLGMGEVALMKYKAAQAGVAAEASHLILQFENMTAAIKRKADADAEAARMAKQAAANEQDLVQTLREEILVMEVGARKSIEFKTALAQMQGVDISKPEIKKLIDDLELLKLKVEAAADAEARLAANDAFAKKAASAAELVKAGEYVRWWADALEQAELAEAELQAVDAFNKKATDAAKLVQASAYVRWWQDALADAERQERELAETEAFNKKTTEAAKLASAIDYVNWWNRALAEAEQQEKELAETKAFDQKAADAAKLVKATEYVRWWEDALQEAEKQEKKLAAEDDFVRKLQRMAAEIGKTRAELLELQAVELGVADRAAPFIQRLKEQEDGLSHVNGMSRATANAMRQLPAQFTDIFVSLASGQQPMTVFLQQGGQIKDMFGGVGPALTAVGQGLRAALSPMVLLTAAAVGLLLAYKAGSDESDALAKSVIMTGGAAGRTSGQLQEMAKSVSGVVGTQYEAAAALVAIVGSGQAVAGSLELLTTAAVRAERSLGQGLDTTSKAFKDLGGDPLKASIRLNESMNYLTDSVYRQIKALTEQGRTVEAARLAQEEYARALTDRSEQMEQRLGLIEKAWRGLKDVAKEAWDAMLDVGREKTPEQKIVDLQARIAANLRRTDRADSIGPNGQRRGADAELVDLQAQLDGQQELIRMNGRVAASKEEQARKTKALIEWDQAGTEFMSKQEKMAQEIARARNLGAAAGQTEVEIAKRIGEIREKYADKSISNDAVQARLKQLEEEMKWWSTVYKDAQAHIVDLQKDGTLSEAEAIRQRAEIRGREIADEQESLTKRMAILHTQKGMEKELAQAKGDYARLGAQGVQEAAQAEADARRAETEAWRKNLDAQVELARKAADDTERLRVQNDQSAAGLIVDSGDRIIAQFNAQIAGLKIQRAAAVRDLDSKILAERDPDRLKYLMSSRDDLSAQYDRSEQLAGSSQISEFVKAGNNVDFAAGFDKASASLGAFTTQFQKLIELQSTYAAMLKLAGDDEAAQNAVRTAMARQQVATYANLTGSAKGFFKEGSKGYKALSAAEKAFRAYEIVMAVKSAAEKIGLITSVTAAKVAGDQIAAQSATASVGPEIAAQAAKGQAAAVAAVANQGNGDPYTAFPRIAAMIAIMTALGFVVAGGAASGQIGTKGSFAPTNNGTGAVLGDSSKQSESITNAVERLRDVDTMTMRYSAQMLAALESIEANISGVTTLLIRSGNLDASAANVKTGFISPEGIGGIIDKAFGISQANSLLKTIPLIGNGLSNLATRDFNKLFGTRQSVVGQGISADPQSIAAISSNGFQASYYADVEKKSKFLGMTTSTSRSTQLTAADAELERQFGLIVTGFADTMRAAAVPLGQSLSVIESRLSSFVVNIGRIDLQGLTGDQINEKLTAVFGALGDQIAKSVLPGLDDFQKVGEGYLETVARVATGIEEARAAMHGLGISIIDLSRMTNKQADDLAAEAVRESIVAAETVTKAIVDAATGAWDGWKGIGTRYVSAVSSIGEIIQNLTGSAEEIAGAYKALVGVRNTLTLLAMDGQAVSYALLQGAGGLNALTDALETFEDGFFTDAEKIGFQSSRMRYEFQKLGIALPASREQFVSLVRGIDTSTEAGQELLGSVLGLSDGLDQLFDAMESAQEAAKENAKAFTSIAMTKFEQAALEYSRLNGEFQKLGLAMPATTADLRAMILGIDSSSTAGRALLDQLLPLAQDFYTLTDSITAIGQAVTTEVTRIRGLITNTSTAGNMASLQAQFAVKTAAARAGDQTALDALPQLSKDLLDMASKQAGTRAELVSIQAATANSLEQTLAIVNNAIKTGTPETTTLEDWIKAFEQVQITVAPVINVPVTVTPAPAAETPVVTANPNAGQPNWAAYVSNYADLAAEFQRLMSGSASDAIAKGLTTPEAYGQWHWATFGSGEGRTLPQFADGGDHIGGWRIVGEMGPELEATGPARYFSAEQTAAMFSGGGGGDMAAEVRALRSVNEALLREVASLRADQQAQAAAIASNTGKTARILDRVAPNGDAIATREAEAL